jgi:hypothetical protein
LVEASVNLFVRWFDDSMLDCCVPHEVVMTKGITLPKLACLARCNGAHVSFHSSFFKNCSNSGQVALRYGSEITLNEFRNDIIQSCSSDFNNGHGTILIVSYNRNTLNQTGTGHFSPIGGYAPQSDMVLIMDVARFKVYLFYSFVYLSYRCMCKSLIDVVLFAFTICVCVCACLCVCVFVDKLCIVSSPLGPSVCPLRCPPPY